MATKNNAVLIAVAVILAIAFLMQLSDTGASVFRHTLRGGQYLNAPICGNNICEPPKETFTMCPEDCHLGDGRCQPQYGENNNNAPMDCRCGDFVCASPETPTTCQTDCYVCGDSICHVAEINAALSTACAQDCSYMYNDNICDSNQGESATDSADCVICGDSICTLQSFDPGYVEDCAQDCPCTDTDGGENANVKGTCTDFQENSGTDVCRTVKSGGPAPPMITVTEWFCEAGRMGATKTGTGSGLCTTKSIMCPDQCVDGACVKIIMEPSRLRM